jgi:ABC-type transport system substrate-binding protein
MSEFFAKAMADIGIKIIVNTNTWPQLTQKTKKRQAQMFGMAWLGDYPDGENFLQLIYGPNSAPGPNGGNYNDPKFNADFDIAKNMQPGPERAKLYAKLAQQSAEQIPLMLGVHRTSFVLKHSWLKNYKFSSFSSGNAKYYDIDLSKKKKVIESGSLKDVDNKTASN